MNEPAFHPNYYAIIPADVRYDKDITPNAKLLYGEITALSNDKGYCYAGNQYFAGLYGVHKTRVSKWISSLEKKGHIKVEIDSKTFERHISIPVVQKDKGGSQKGQAPLSKRESPLVENDNDPCPKGQHNNTVNNTPNNTVAPATAEAAKIEVVGIGEITVQNIALYVSDVSDTVRLQFLNEQVGRLFPTVTELQKAVRAFRDKSKPAKPEGMKRPSLEEVTAYMAEKNLPPIEAERFFNYHESKGWVVGNRPMAKWKAAVSTWKNSPYHKPESTPVQQIPSNNTTYQDLLKPEFR